jgi:hypothetical protein
MSVTPDNTLADPEQLIADLQRQLSDRVPFKTHEL